MLRNVFVLILFFFITFNLAVIASYTIYCLEAIPPTLSLKEKLSYS